MGEIRHFTEEHVSAVADLTLKAIRGRRVPAGAGLQNCFRDILLQNPWLSPDIQSLVYLDQGKVIGFLGIVPRTMDFRGKLVRVAVTTQFMIDREQHRGSAALELMKHFFRGPQDVSFTDGAGEGAALVWTAAGGRTARLYSLNWTRVLRPLGTALSVLNLGRAARIISSPGDFIPLLCNNARGRVFQRFEMQSDACSRLRSRYTQKIAAGLRGSPDARRTTGKSE